MYLYYQYLEMLLNEYSRYKKILLPSRYKIYQFIHDDEYRRKSSVKKEIDNGFIELFIKCINEPNGNNSFQNITLLKEYVLSGMGGFQIDGWKLHTPSEI
jgi:hypothetical protein